MTFVMCQDEEKNNLFQHKEQQTDCRDCSMVKSDCCSCRRLFRSQHPEATATCNSSFMEPNTLFWLLLLTYI